MAPSDPPLLGDPGQLNRLTAMTQIDRLPTHGDQHIGAVRPVPRRLGETQGLDEVPLGEAVGGDVVRRPAGEPGEVGDGAEEPAPGRLAVAAAEHRLGLVLQIADEGLSGVPASVGVVEGAEQLPHRAQGRDVAAGDPLPRSPIGAVEGPLTGQDARARLMGDPYADGAALGATDPLVRSTDEPIPARHHEPGGGECDLAQFPVTARVLAPQSADDVDGFLGGGRELQSGVDGGTGVEPEVLRGKASTESPGEDFGDEGGRGAAWLLATEPASDGRLVVAEVEAVLKT